MWSTYLSVATVLQVPHDRVQDLEKVGLVLSAQVYAQVQASVDSAKALSLVLQTWLSYDKPHHAGDCDTWKILPLHGI